MIKLSKPIKAVPLPERKEGFKETVVLRLTESYDLGEEIARRTE